MDPTLPVEDDEDDEEDMYPDAEVLPYPKAGNGVVLEDEGKWLALLVDEGEGVYSHVWDWGKRAGEVE